MKRKVLITGGAGYIGSVLVPKLLNLGYDVTVFDNLFFEQTTLLECCQYSDFHFVYGDVRNFSLLKKNMTDKDIIIPLAALVGMPLCEKDHVAATAINRVAIVEINKIRSKDQIIIYPTTNSGYGIGEEGIYCTEETPLKPISVYGITKVEAEQDLLSSQNVISFRLATVFGVSPRMRLDLLVNDFVFKALKQKYIVLFEAHFKRNYIHIQDVCRAFIFAIDNFEKMKNDKYNIGITQANLSKMELCLKIKEYIPDFFIHESEFNKDIDQRNYIISNEKIEKCGFKTKWTLDMGIQELIKSATILSNKKFFSNV